ncbi:MAG TPA: valine--tRNA ligase [Acidimicrobiales bacterium]|nr:valine--tRNA ligase [Acidimicrobiales bacterium]
MSPNVPEKPTLDGLEPKQIERWESERTYAFDRTKERGEIFSIDTPPPTVSGALHIGHVYSFTHTDLVARFQRMRGKEVFYPIGWDDNGLPTERRVENYFGVRCDPSLPFDASFEPPSDPPKQKISISRPNFVALCERLTAEDEEAYKALWRRLGLSIDWSLEYTTIGDRARRVAQREFLRNLARGEAYQTEAPTLWDVDFQTAVAQAELEDREASASYHRVAFHRTDGGGDVIIETTRPELLPACVALVAHPDDARYQPLFGTMVSTPLFGVRVPVVAHELADPEKGSGIAMICTFGDTTDITWWRELQLPIRAILGRDGRLRTITWGDPGWEADDVVAAQRSYDRLAGEPVKRAQKAIVEMLRDSGELLDEPRPITHPVKFYENGERPLEIVTSRQWYIRNGGRDDDLRAALLERGRELSWNPSFMRHRFEDWVGGLNGDWLVSRQRYFGVPIPLWYPLDAEGEVVYDAAIVPDEASLPVDPSAEAPPGYTDAQRGQPGGFIGEPDIMDTWATSSLSPQIVGGWEDDNDLFKRLFPMDLRPQSHEIIRTWLFYTVVRAHQEHGVLPWKEAAISGWVVDNDRKKMSKSKGNATTPMAILEEYGSDAVRYWASCARLGTDTSPDAGQFKVGRRLAIKLLNASRFTLSRVVDVAATGAVTEPLDRAMLAQLGTVIEEATAAFEGYDHARALERTEAFFWSFCDDYLELVKGRAYGEATSAGATSASAALSEALSALIRLLAPFLPFATDEVWSWWQEGSVHRAPWPTAWKGDGDPAVLDAAADVIAQVRKAKTDAKQSMRATVTRAVVRDTAERIAALTTVAHDIKAAGVIDELTFEPADELTVTVTLADPT